MVSTGTRTRATLTVLASLAFALPVAAQDTVPPRLPAVVVTRDVGRSPLDLPFAISTTQPDSLVPGVTRMLVDQALAFIPGLTVANRSNPSQDTRISIRGFGARSPFGVRSLRVLRDGMPLTLPDGQTPLDYLDLESVGRVETIRGSTSALYGNASGGVVELRSGPPPSARAGLQGRSWTGSDGLRRYVGLLGGTIGAASYLGNIGRTMTDGHRAYAQQRLTNAFVRAGTVVGGTELSLVGLGLDMPVAENPGALTRIQFDTNSRMADPLSVSKRARKEVHQVQIGAQARRAVLGDGDAQLQLYGAGRSLFNPLTFAIVGIDRHSSGASARVTIPASTGRLRHRITVGADAQRLSDARKNWANCNAVATATAACPTVGVEKGNLRLDQREIVNSLGPYLRDELEIGIVRATVGVRADNTTFEARDAFLSDGRDDSGKRSMRAVSPMAGIAVRGTPMHSWYANIATAFETPTTTELGNQADGSAGFNAGLLPQNSTTIESGVKGWAFSRVQYDIALYSTRVRDELISFDAGSGRTAFRNAGRTSRRGAEVYGATEVGPLTLTTAYTYSHFRFVDFTTGTTQQAGHSIPGIPEQQVQLGAAWRVRRSFVAAEWIAKGKVYVNDANATAAPGFAITNMRVGTTAVFGRPWLAPVVGVQNVFDRKHVASVAVNAAGATLAASKFYEPGPGRTWFVGLSAATTPW